MTLTDCLSSDIQIVPTITTPTAENMACLFFNHWYCKNSLPLEIILDCNKLFLSHFWVELHKLTGVKLKMLTAYHPELDRVSKLTNKTIIQCIHFAVECNQQGWVHTLPKVWFDIMNTINASTGFLPFQLCFRKAVHILPPIISLDDTKHTEPSARELITQMQPM